MNTAWLHPARPDDADTGSRDRDANDLEVPALTGVKPGRGFIWTGVALIVVGLLLGVVGVFGVIAQAGRALSADFRSSVVTTPTTVVRHLEPATYVVYEQTGTTHRRGVVTTTQDNAVTLTPGQVKVTDASGASLPLDVPPLDETLTRGDLIYTGAVQFVVHDS